MPKIIENVRETLINEMRQQVDANGYAATSIRSVAKACGIAAGTVYNYFPSKDALIAVFMAEDWMSLAEDMKNKCRKTDDPMKVIEYIHEGLSKYVEDHKKLFNDPQASIGFASSNGSRHEMLIGQLTTIVGPVCRKKAKVQDADVPLFVIETLLNWTMQGREISDYYKIISQLFN